MVKKSKLANKFKANNTNPERAQNTREIRNVKEELPLICFNFKDFDRNQIPPGQSFEQWQKDGLLSKLLEKLKKLFQFLCLQMGIAEAKKIMTRLWKSQKLMVL